ncbi:MAG: putative ribosomal large subunit pseudouridine synthase RluB, partial [Pseudomonadota bacterium]|jgi:23S rRNA pseudouridine2605 synthase
LLTQAAGGDEEAFSFDQPVQGGQGPGQRGLRSKFGLRRNNKRGFEAQPGQPDDSHQQARYADDQDEPYDPLDEQPPANADHMGTFNKGRRKTMGLPPGGGRGQGHDGDHGDGLDAMPKNVDPMKTSFGYIGADSFMKQRNNQGQGRGKRSGKPRR